MGEEAFKQHRLAKDREWYRRLKVTRPETYKARIKKVSDRWKKEQLSRQNWLCGACQCDLHTHTIHVDHILPIAKGGTNKRSNLWLLCAKCNLDKRDHFIFL